ncbi:hypothetical protein Pint_28937 [Pistacia integerrima]|uniref:Uncharacterized protein n=1 Tax=Pistacia integerrima TaxID=434235 RepID=A0ACC0X149_9ROSI|nr:hypothetical protein Pint_28937 [Pistacia integerrima]
MAISSLCLFLLFSLFLGQGVVELEASHHVYQNLQTSESTSESQPYRTGYHFQPPKNWMNDPNGPMIYKGIYHLFYQYNPKGAVWGNIVWAHSTSTDLINWTPHAAAIYPSQKSDVNGCWSGSATILPGGKPAILYTGIDPNNTQVQNLAVPKNLSDPFLIEWVKSPKNPLMAPTAMNQINVSSFRDPTTAWLGPDKKWRVIIGSKINHKGLAILYSSKNFVEWTQAKLPLHSAEGTGMWECPDFFPVATEGVYGVETSKLGSSIKHVLKVSLDDTKHEYYTIGTYDISADKYVPDKGQVDSDSGLRYDYGKFYASKTFFDSLAQRRILWGWINESSSVEHDIKKGWSGVQADIEASFKIPGFEKAEVLDPSWTNPQLLCSQKGASVKGALGPFGFLVLSSKSLEEYTAVFFRIFKGHGKYVVLMCSDQSRSSLDADNDKTTYGAFVDVDPVHESLSLRSLIDHSIVESFGGGGKACITARVYPTLAIDHEAHLYAFNYGTEKINLTNLSAWSLKKAQINQAYRTGYHFQPPKNWINVFYLLFSGFLSVGPAVIVAWTNADPNGVMIHKGIYHLFYQYNPKGVVWGNIVWAHSTSEDLINWISHEPAIFPSQKSDINGCWSGSATILPGDKPAILYTGIDPDKKQVQNLAFPKNLSDPYLKEWEKFPKQPTYGTQLQKWSEDFITWSEAKRPLHSGKRTGMWECPDFYPVAVDNFTGLDTSTLGEKVKHVLKVSLDNYKHDYYTIGHYNYKTDKYVPDKGSIEGDKGLKYDYGKFYASKTFFDSAKNRRVLWGWINESSSVEDDVKKGWSGIQAIPRIVWLDKSGKQLMQWPVTELETLRDTKVNLENKSLDAGSFHEVTGITAAQADIDISFEISDINKAETTYGAFVNVDPVSEKISLRSLIDHSIVASFGGGGKSCITARVYPTLAVEDKAHLYVFNNGSEAVKIVSLNAWSMKDAQIN